MTMNLARLASPLLAASLLVATPAAAQTAERALPANAAELDGYLETKDYASLTRILVSATDGNTVLRNMNWEQKHVLAGGTFFLDIVYARDTWRLAAASAVAKPTEAHELQKTAVMILFYAYEVGTIESVRCADSSAPGNRVTQLFGVNGGLNFMDLWRAFGTTFSDTDRQQVIQTALNFESRTASLRSNDDFLCRGGKDELASTNLSGPTNQHLATHDKPAGTVQLVVPNNPAYQPKFVDEPVWRPKQTALREPAAKEKLVKDLAERFVKRP